MKTTMYTLSLLALVSCSLVQAGFDQQSISNTHQEILDATELCIHAAEKCKPVCSEAEEFICARLEQNQSNYDQFERVENNPEFLTDLLDNAHLTNKVADNLLNRYRSRKRQWDFNREKFPNMDSDIKALCTASDSLKKLVDRYGTHDILKGAASSNPVEAQMSKVEKLAGTVEELCDFVVENFSEKDARIFDQYKKRLNTVARMRMQQLSTPTSIYSFLRHVMLIKCADAGGATWDPTLWKKLIEESSEGLSALLTEAESDRKEAFDRGVEKAKVVFEGESKMCNGFDRDILSQWKARIEELAEGLSASLIEAESDRKEAFDRGVEKAKIAFEGATEMCNNFDREIRLATLNHFECCLRKAADDETLADVRNEIENDLAKIADAKKLEGVQEIHNAIKGMLGEIEPRINAYGNNPSLVKALRSLKEANKVAPYDPAV